MKKLLPIIFILFAHASFAQVCNIAQLPSNLQSGLVAYYPFCGNANDGSGNGNNGTVNGAALTSDRFGSANSAYYFSSAGCGTHIQANINTSSIQTSLTISIWIARSGSGCNGPRILEINNLVDGPGSTQWTWDNANSTYFGSQTSNGTAPYTAFGVRPNNVWTFLVYTNDGSLANFYQDGLLISSLPSSGNPILGQSAAFGRMNHPAYDAFNGKLDDIMIYNRALSACEVSQLHNATSTSIPTLQPFSINTLSDTTRACGTSQVLDAGAGFATYSWNTGAITQTINATTGGVYKVTVTNAAGCTASDSTLLSLINANILQNDTTICKRSSITLSIDSLFPGRTACNVNQLPTNLRDGLVAYYPFCGNANDASGNGNNGVVNGATLTTDRFGNTNSAYGLSTISDNLTVNGVQPNFNNLAITVSLWVKFPSQWNQSSIALLKNGTPYTNGFNLAIDQNNSAYGVNNYAVIFLVGNYNAVTFIANQSELGTWSNITGSYDGSNLKIYLNGILKATQAYNQSMNIQNNNLIFGSWDNPTTPLVKSRQLDDILIYNRALTQEEIQQLYSNRPIVTWSTGDTTNTITVNPTQTTTYYATVSDGITSCTDSVKITVNDIGLFNPLQDTTRVCGTSQVLDAGAGYATYSWNTGATTQSINATTGGVYKVTVTNASGCSASDSTLLSLVNANILNNDTTICKGSSITLSIDSLFPGHTACNVNQLPTNLRNGLVAYYPFCGNANDGSGNGNNGIVNGAVLSTDRFGSSNNSFSFLGQSSNISVNNIISSQNFSISLWYNTSDSTDISQQHLFYQGINEISITRYSYLNKLKLFCGVKLANDQFYYTTGSNDDVNLVYNSWQNIVMTCVRGDKVKLYLNGQLIDQSGILPNLDYWNAQLSTSIGAYNSSSQFFNGRIDDVFVWNRALSANEISQLYQNTASVTWSQGGATTNSITVNPTQTTTYYVTVSDGITTCIDSVKITVNDIGPFNPLQDTTRICGTNQVLDAGAGYTTYSWNTGATTQTITATTGGVYKVTATNAAGCSASDSTLLSLVNANILNNDTTICRGRSINLSIDSSAIGGICSWNQVQPGDCYKLVPGQNGNLFITRRTDVLKSTNNGLTWQPANWPLGIVRSGTSLWYGATYSSFGAGQLHVSALDNGYFISNNNGTSFTQTGPTGFGCAGMDLLSLSNGRVLAAMGGFQRGIYKSSGAVNNIWNNKFPGTDPLDFTRFTDDTLFSGTGNYLLKSTNAGESWSILRNQSVVDVEKLKDSLLWVDGTGKLYIDKKDNIGGGVYTPRYNFNGSIFDLKYDSASNTIVAAHQTQGIYISRDHGFTWTQCSIPAVTSYYDVCFYSGKIYVGTDKGLYSRGVFVQNLNVLWSTGSTGNSITVTPAQTTTYYVTLSDGITTCTDSVKVTISDLGPFNPLQDTTRVCGTSQVLDAGAGFASYSWNTGATTQTITATTGGNYKVTVTNATGCSAIDSTLLSLVNANILQNDTTICKGSSMTLSIDSLFPGRTTCTGAGLPTNLRNGLVGYWPFCGNANDASGNGNNGIVNGATLTTDRFGKMNSAYSFNGLNNYVLVNNSPSLNSASISISGWVNLLKAPTLTAGSSGDVALISKWYQVVNCNGNSDSYIAEFANYNGSTKLIGASNVYSGTALNSSTNIALNDWYHFVFTHNQNGGGEIYINGILVGANSDLGSICNSTNPLYFGADVNLGSLWRFLNGKLDDIGIWNRALTQAEVQQLYTNRPTVNWSTGDTTNSITVNPTQTTTYYVTVSDGITTCTDSVKITVNDIGLFNPLQDTTRVCGTSQVLDAGAGFATYSWSTGATTQSINATTGGVYKVTVTNATGCTASDSTFLSLVNANILQNDTTICRGSSITLSIDSLFPGRTVCTAAGLPANLRNRLVGYWPFCGNANDVSGNGNNGNVNGASLTSDRYGASNSAYDFNGTNSSIEISNSFFNNGWDSSSVTFWFLPRTESGVASNGPGQTILNTFPHNGLGVGYSYLSSQRLYVFKNSNPGIFSWDILANNEFNASPIILGKWHHVSIVKSGLQYLYYFNGILDKSLSTLISPLSYLCSLRIGAITCCNPETFNGKIDDLLIHNRSLSATEVKFLADLSFSNVNWSTGVTTNTITVNPTQTTTYYVTVSDGITTCTDSVKINVSSVDTSLTVLDPTQVCSNGGSVRLQAGIATSYQWLKNGVAISGANAQLYTATQTGLYRVALTNALGCRDTSRAVQITLNPQPVVNFTINSVNQCLTGNSFVFTNTSTISTGTLTHQWSFGDGATATSTNATHTYLTAGTYTVKLVTTSNNGCKDSTTQTVTVNPNPSVSFTVNTIAQCLTGNSFVFNNTSTISAGTITHQWSFGDGVTATTTNATHTYLTAGTYTVKLVTTSNNGCTDSITRTVTVNPNPTVSFTVNTATQCLTGNSFVFTNTSTISAGTITHQWSFGDGATATTTNATHTYLTAGTYTVKLVTTSNNGCKDSTTQIVTVIPTPTVSFTINNATQCLNGNSFVFTNSSTISTGTITHQWSFGDGATAATTNATHTYLTAGTYTVKLVTTSNNGCKDSTTQTVTVNPNPSVSFTVNTIAQCLTGNSFVFTNTSTISAGTLTHQWSFGDGATATTTNATYTYLTPGTYTVKLVTTSNNGCRDSITRSVTVNPKPTVSFNINTATQCVNGNSFVFTNTSTISAGTLTHQWSFGDGATATTANATYTYLTPGTYTVKLVTTSNNGCRDSITRSVTVNPKPTVSFNINTASQCVNGNSFVFTNTSTISAGTLTHQWSFGDGATATTTNATHTYLTAGTYSVKLVTTSNNGCKDSTIQTVTVNPTPTVSFTINNATQCLNGNSFVFTNTSTISSGTLTHQWSFGDGGTATSINASYTYLNAGTYTVKLVTTSNNGCKDSITRSVTVNPNPSPSFTVNTVAQCLTGNSFVYTNTSTISVGTLTHLWSFGDGATATTTNATHTYLTAGTYTVKLVTTSNNGCKDSTTRTVVVNPLPIGILNAPAQNHICDGTPLTLTASGAFSYQWYLNGSAITGATSSSYDATVAGSYTVEFISDLGCRKMSGTTIVLTLIKKPDASFTNSNYCTNVPVSFTNTSIVSGSGQVSYQWMFGDGSSSISTNPTHVYTLPANYMVLLTVTPQLCPQLKDTAMKLIRIEAPVPGISYSPINTVVNVPITLSARNIGISYSWSPTTGLTNPGTRTPTLMPTRQQLYLVRIINSAGCTTIDSQLVRIFNEYNIYVPEAFTPDGDGNNDLLYPFLVGIRELKYLKVFNRWGNLVFETKTANPAAGWNGIYKGKAQPSETFVWIAEGIDLDGKVIKRGGNVILVR